MVFWTPSLQWCGTLSRLLLQTDDYGFLTPSIDFTFSAGYAGKTHLVNLYAFSTGFGWWRDLLHGRLLGLFHSPLKTSCHRSPSPPLHPQIPAPDPSPLCGFESLFGPPWIKCSFSMVYMMTSLQGNSRFRRVTGQWPVYLLGINLSEFVYWSPLILSEVELRIWSAWPFSLSVYCIFLNCFIWPNHSGWYLGERSRLQYEKRG